MIPCCCAIYCSTGIDGSNLVVLSVPMETRNLQHEDHPSSHSYSCHSTCAHSVGNGYLTFAPHSVTCSSKIDMVCKELSAWIWKVLDGTNPWKEHMANFDEPRQISCGSSSFRCVRVPGYTWPLITLQS